MTINPQNNNYNKEVNSFSDSVKKYLKIKKMTQADLIRKSMLTRTTVSRICRNSNDKGSTYQPTDRIVMSVCVALGLDSKETKELFNLAFPYLKC
ncbi:MAG: helix-turn-helix transcriptional regulator, partial [Clostridium sp.]|nr:helix-turn-helix transcriptional regulator [Clostridium sp.]